MESDKMLYDLLRAQYTELTGRWKRLLSLRQISQIRFVKVSNTYPRHTRSKINLVPTSHEQARHD